MDALFVFPGFTTHRYRLEDIVQQDAEKWRGKLLPHHP
jgi:hypothetical protein